MEKKSLKVLCSKDYVDFVDEPHLKVNSIDESNMYPLIFSKGKTYKAYQLGNVIYVSSKLLHCDHENKESRFPKHLYFNFPLKKLSSTNCFEEYFKLV